jgi:exodeoxyribonuclease VII small subunit
MAAQTKAKSAEADPAAKFEDSLGELEALIAKLEAGELSLDQSVQGFAHGMALYESCKASLDQAQLKVELLLKGASEIGVSRAFDPQNP